MKSTKKVLALLLCAAMVMSSTACGRARAQKPGTTAKTEDAPIPITILTRPNFELEANTIRDQLTKAGLRSPLMFSRTARPPWQFRRAESTTLTF